MSEEKSFDKILNDDKFSQESLDASELTDQAALKEVATIISIFLSVERQAERIHDASNTSENFSLVYMPQIRLHFASTYPLFFVLYGIVLFGAVFLNVGLLYYLTSKRFFGDPIFLYIANLAVSDLLLVIFGIPYKLSVTLFQSFILGKFLCYTGSMLQQIPSLLGILTYLVLAADRYRRIYYPLKPPLPPQISLLVVWIVAFFVPLPSSFFHGYVDMSRLWKHFRASFAVMSLPLDFLENHRVCYLFIHAPVFIYARVIFTLFYALPLAVIGLLYVRCSLELTNRANQASHIEQIILSPINEDPLASPRHGNTPVLDGNGLCSQQNLSIDGLSPDNADQESASQLITISDQETADSMSVINRYLASMTTIYAIAWMPIRVLNLSHPLFLELSERRGEKYLDMCYITFALFSFGATWVNPIILARWKPVPSTLSAMNVSQTQNRFTKLSRVFHRETPRSSYNSTEF